MQPSNVDVATGNDGLVVLEVLPIVQIGSTLRLQRTLNEEDGKIPFDVKKLPATEIAIITKSKNPLFVDGSKVRAHVHKYLHFLFLFNYIFIIFYFFLH